MTYADRERARLATRRAVVATGGKLAYVAPLAAASVALTATPAAALVSGPPGTGARPTAILEIFGPSGALADGTLSCDANRPRSSWTWSRPGNGLVFWGCNDDQFSDGTPTDPAFRGTASTDPDGDVASWSIDFGDGTAAGGRWAGDPPISLVHARPPFLDAFAIGPVVTPTVTDASGQTDSDALRVVFTGPD